MGLRDLINKVPTPLKQAVKEAIYPDMLLESTAAPEWQLQDHHGNWHRLKGKRWALMIFYPGDDTPGCTLRDAEVRKYDASRWEHGFAVLGVNPAEAVRPSVFAE